MSAAGAFWMSRSQAAHEREMRQRSEEIAELTRQNAALQTGGDSYATVVLLPGDSGQIRAVLTNHGDYPVFNIRMRIVDLDAAKPAEPMSVSEVFQSGQQLTVDYLGPKEAVMLKTPLALSRGFNSNYTVHYHARNGSWTQQERVLGVADGRLVRARRVQRQLHGQPLRTVEESVPPGFPLNAEGVVEW